MSDHPTPLHETLLRQGLAGDSIPWYPKEYAEATGINREALYAPLNDLRVANLVQLTEWVEGKGQGYLITALGREVLNDPIALAHLREGNAAIGAAVQTDSTADDTEPTTFAIGEAARQVFFTPGRVRVVPILILINVVAFLASLALASRLGIDPTDFLKNGDIRALHQLGAVSAEDIAHGQWWRLLTSCFLHFGLPHILLNMTSLFLARRVEVLWGSGRFLTLYLICGICGSCVGVYYHPGEGGTVVYLAGASGALWGVMMSEVVWLLLNRSHLPPAAIRLWLQQMFFTLLLNVGVSMLPQVSSAAHVGGGVAGILAAFLLRAHKLGPATKRTIAGINLALLPAIFMLGLAVAMESDHRLQPFLADIYREQINDRVGRLLPVIDELEPHVDRLFLQESDRRDPADVARVHEGLQGLVKQANEAGEWAKKTSPVDHAKPMRESGIALVEAVVPFAEALDRQANGATVGNTNQLRKNYQQARTAWFNSIK